MGSLDKVKEMKSKAESLAEQAKDMASNVAVGEVVVDESDELTNTSPVKRCSRMEPGTASD